MWRNLYLLYIQQLKLTKINSLHKLIFCESYNLFFSILKKNIRAGGIYLLESVFKQKKRVEKSLIKN